MFYDSKHAYTTTPDPGAGRHNLLACLLTSNAGRAHVPLIDLTLEQLSAIVVTSVAGPRVLDALPRLALAGSGYPVRAPGAGARIGRDL